MKRCHCNFIGPRKESDSAELKAFLQTTAKWDIDEGVNSWLQFKWLTEQIHTHVHTGTWNWLTSVSSTDFKPLSPSVKYTHTRTLSLLFFPFFHSISIFLCFTSQLKLFTGFIFLPILFFFLRQLVFSFCSIPVLPFQAFSYSVYHYYTLTHTFPVYIINIAH